MVADLGQFLRGKVDALLLGVCALLCVAGTLAKALELLREVTDLGTSAGLEWARSSLF